MLSQVLCQINADFQNNGQAIYQMYYNLHQFFNYFTSQMNNNNEKILQLTRDELMTQYQQKQVIQRVKQIKKRNTILLNKLFIVKKSLQENLKNNLQINAVVLNQQKQVTHQMRLMRQKLHQKHQTLKRLKYETQIKKKKQQIRNEMLNLNRQNLNQQAITRYKRLNLRINPQVQRKKQNNKRSLTTKQKQSYQLFKYLGQNVLSLKETVAYYKAQQNAYLSEILPKQQFRQLHSNIDTNQLQQCEI